MRETLGYRACARADRVTHGVDIVDIDDADDYKGWLRRGSEGDLEVELVVVASGDPGAAA